MLSYRSFATKTKLKQMDKTRPPIRAILIDDEENARFLLNDLIQRNYADQVEVVAHANDVDSGYDAILSYKPDIVFLDIKMQKGTGFDLLEKFDGLNFEVVFVTAYDQYAIKAFEFSAFGYLLKPVKSSELGKVITRMEARMLHPKEDKDNRIKVLIDSFGNHSGDPKRLVISNMEGFKVVEIPDIIRLEASSNYTYFFLTGDRKILVSKTLGEYEGLLNDQGFFRIHQSHIVNLAFVEGFIKQDGGAVKLKDGTTLMVSRNRKAAFLSRFV